MTMADWVIANYVDPNNGNAWVYYTNPNFPGIHFSRNVANPNNDHMGTDAPPASSYYYGNTGVFAGAPAAPAVQANLTAAWNDYYTV